MVSRRSQTSMNTEQPVRFYKLIALGFLLLTVILLGLVVFMSSKRAEIIVTTKLAPVDVTSDVIFGGSDSHGIEYEIVTKEISDSRIFSPTGTKQEEGVAKGFVTLINDGALDQPLVATTRLLTDKGILFRLKDRVVVPANGELEQVEVYADKVGVESEIGPETFTIPGLNEAKQKIIYAKSDEAMVGGIRNIGILSEDDVEQAEESMRAFIEKKAVEDLAETYKDKKSVYNVTSLTTSVNEELIGTEVDSFTLSASGTVHAVFYDEEDMKNWAEKQLSKKSIDQSDSIKPSDQQPTVTFASYNNDQQLATLRVFYDGLMTLSPESPTLSKEVFFGKSKNEVRRYLLTLDHVQKVDIKLQPAWIDTIPQIHEHVSVVIKQVE